MDLNGKKMAWQGVSLLPFVEEGRLLSTLEKVYPMLTPEEKERNVRGLDRLFIGEKHEAFQFFMGQYESFEGDRNVLKEEKDVGWSEMQPSLANGLAGKVAVAPLSSLPGEIVISPVDGCADLNDNKSICVLYKDPQFPPGYTFAAKRLKGAKEPARELKPGKWDDSQGRYRPMIGMDGRGPRGSLGNAGHRMLGHQGMGMYANVPPPRDMDQRGRGGNRRSYGGGGYGRGGGGYDRGGGGGYGRGGGGGYGRGGGDRRYDDRRHGSGGYRGDYNRGGDRWQQRSQQHYSQNMSQQYYGVPYEQRGGYRGGGGYPQQHRQQQQRGFKRPGASDYF